MKLPVASVRLPLDPVARFARRHSPGNHRRGCSTTVPVSVASVDAQRRNRREQMTRDETDEAQRLIVRCAWISFDVA